MISDDARRGRASLGIHAWPPRRCVEGERPANPHSESFGSLDAAAATESRCGWPTQCDMNLRLLSDGAHNSPPPPPYNTDQHVNWSWAKQLGIIVRNDTIRFVIRTVSFREFQRDSHMMMMMMMKLPILPCAEKRESYSFVYRTKNMR